MNSSSGLDFLLWNSFMGKAYSVSDCFKENGIGVLTRACKNAGFHFAVEDPAKIEFYLSFANSELIPRLSELFVHIFQGKNVDIGQFKAEWNVLQENLAVNIREKMMEYIHALARRVHDNQVKVLGIKTWLGDRFTYSEMLTKRVNELSPDTVVIAGGPQVNQFKTSALENSPFDFCIDIEGEVTLIKIIQIVKAMYEQGKSKTEVKKHITELAKKGALYNLVYRDNGAIKETAINRLPLNLKPYPFYEKNDGKVDIAVINESAGCYYGKCNFCTHPNITGKYQARDIDTILCEIKETIKDMGIGLFRFAGSTTPVALGKKIADALLNEGITIEYSMFVRSENKAKNKEQEIMRSYEKIIYSGLRAVFLGVEVANDNILSRCMDKGNSVDDIFFTIKAIKQASKNLQKHIDVGVSFIYPCPLPPGDSITLEQVLDENILFLQKLKDEECPPDSVLITPAVPLPGTLWIKEPERFGFELPKDYLQRMLRYEYELTKDPSTWPELDFTLRGIKFLDMLKLTGMMEQKVRELGYTVNVSDEHCLAARSAGFMNKQGLDAFKMKSDMALLTTDYAFLKDAYQKINSYSHRLAEKNYL